MTGATEQLLALLKKRRSQRSFLAKSIDESVLKTLAQSFALAPQAGGHRGLTCEFITERDKIKNLAEVGQKAFSKELENFSNSFVAEEMERYSENFFWFKDAPALAIITCRRPPSFLEEFSSTKAPLIWGGEISAAMAAFSLLLTAESLGLGACPLTGPLSAWKELEKTNVSPKNSLVLLIALGYLRNIA